MPTPTSARRRRGRPRPVYSSTAVRASRSTTASTVEVAPGQIARAWWNSGASGRDVAVAEAHLDQLQGGQHLDVACTGTPSWPASRSRAGSALLPVPELAGRDGLGEARARCGASASRPPPPRGGRRRRSAASRGAARPGRGPRRGRPRGRARAAVSVSDGRPPGVDDPVARRSSARRGQRPCVTRLQPNRPMGSTGAGVAEQPRGPPWRGSMQARQSPASQADTERRMSRRPSSSGVPPSVSASSAAATLSRNAGPVEAQAAPGVLQQRGSVGGRTPRGGMRSRTRSECRGITARVEATHRDRRQQAERLARLARVQPVLDRRHAGRPCSRAIGRRARAARADARGSGARARPAAPRGRGRAPRTIRPCRSR